MRSTLVDKPNGVGGSRPAPAIHAAIIMDGNGRWAAARGLPRVAGHRRGVESVRAVVRAAPSLGIGTLTLYAFSSDNWNRPRHEVVALMHLFRAHLRGEAPELAASNVRLTVIGRRDRIPHGLRREIMAAEATTAGGTDLHLRLAIDYSSRDAIIRAARALAPDGPWDREAFSAALGESYGPEASAPDVDLLIRTGGEQRVSDFLLWEAAYAELAFTPCMWPEFDGAALESAIADFHSRHRRFGALPAAG